MPMPLGTLRERLDPDLESAGDDLKPLEKDGERFPLFRGVFDPSLAGAHQGIIPRGGRVQPPKKTLRPRLTHGV